MNSELIKLALAQQSDGPQQLRSPPRTQTQQESAILKLKGLPYDTSKDQILKFFQGFDVKNVEFVFEPDGRPSGLAFAEFSAREEAIRAMAKNGEYLGERYVKLLLVPRQEMEEQVKLGTIAIPGGAARARAGLLRRRAQRLPLHAGTSDVLMNVMTSASPVLQHHAFNPTHLAYSNPVQVRDVFPENYMFLQPSPHMQGHMQQHMQGHMQPHMQPHMQGHMQPHIAKPMSHQVQMPMQAHMMTQPQLLAQSHLQQRMRVPMQNLMAHPAMMQSHHQVNAPNTPQMSPLPMPTSAHMSTRGPAPTQQAMPSHSPQDISPTSSAAAAASMAPPSASGPKSAPSYAAPGSDIAPPVSTDDVKTLKIRGLPFRVAPQELLNFFWGFEYVPESLCFGKDSLGRPSGEAWLSFVSHQEAVRAVGERNRQYLRNRYLELSLWHG